MTAQTLTFRFYLLFTLLLSTFEVTLLSPIAHAKNSFLVAPGRVEFDISKPTTESFILTNNGDGKIRLSIAPIYFEIDSPALSMGKHLSAETKEIEDLTKYIRVSPRKLTLNPGQKRNIRISLRAPGNLPEGYFRGHLLIKMLETARTIKSESSESGALGIELGLKMETGVAIFGFKGDQAPVVDLTCSLDAETNSLMLNLKNTTPWKYDGSVEIYNATQPNGEPIYKDLLLVYRESSRNISTNFTPEGSGPFYIQWRPTKQPDQPFTDNMICNL